MTLMCLDCGTILSEDDDARLMEWAAVVQPDGCGCRAWMEAGRPDAPRAAV